MGFRLDCRFLVIVDESESDRIEMQIRDILMQLQTERSSHLTRSRKQMNNAERPGLQCP